MPNKLRDLHVVDRENFAYIFEQNVDVKLKQGDGLCRVNVYRPKSSDEVRVPVLVTYGPYGKDIPYAEYVYDHNGVVRYTDTNHFSQFQRRLIR
jgi:predicted acyl esterase